MKHTKWPLRISMIIFMMTQAVVMNGQGLVPTPPMGWNSWNWFGKRHINEQVVREVIDAMAAEGLRKAGYEYVVIDGGWRDTVLESNGALRVDRKRFPHGIKALADYAHAKGFKFGLHTAPGTADCGGDEVGGYGHEEVQVQQFADWGVDFIKLDQCQFRPGWTDENTKEIYLKWSRLIAHCGRDILLSIHTHFKDFPVWYIGNCQIARTTNDIAARQSVGAYFDTLPKQRRFRSVMANAERNNRFARYAGNGYWNNPDMLPLGAQGLSVPEQKATFALWCIMSAPLILGNDPRHMTKPEKEIVRNRRAIAVDQDPTEQGIRIEKKGYAEIWAKHLSDDRVAVLLLNRSPYDNAQITLDFDRIGLSGRVKVTTVFGGESLGAFHGRFSRSVEPHSGLFLVIASDSVGTARSGLAFF